MKDDWPVFSQEKIIPTQKLAVFANELRRRGKTIATLNGSFDLMHAGHLHIIYQAKQQADILIIAVNSDDSIKRYKGSERPFISLENRIKMLTAIEFVDYVTWFDDDDPREVLSEIKPDVHVNGPEWGENCIEAEVVKKNGGKLHIVKLVEGLSTTNIVEKINATISNI